MKSKKIWNKISTVHRIGRTGRSGRTGIATTFINKANDESVLLDLKHLLMEAKQKVPPFLLELCSENEKYLNLGGSNFSQIYFHKIVFFYIFYQIFSRATLVLNHSIFFFLCRRKGLQLLRRSRSQNHRVSQTRSDTEQTGFEYRSARLFGQ